MITNTSFQGTAAMDNDDICNTKQQHLQDIDVITSNEKDF